VLMKDFNADEICTVGSGSNAVWRYGHGYFQAYTELLAHKKKLLKVRGAVLANRYSYPKAWDFVIPRARLKTVLRILESGGDKLG